MVEKTIRRKLRYMEDGLHDQVMMLKYDHLSYRDLEAYVNKLRKKVGYNRKVKALYRLLVEKENEREIKIIRIEEPYADFDDLGVPLTKEQEEDIKEFEEIAQEAVKEFLVENRK